MAQNVKTVQGIATASVKTVSSIAIANVKTIQGIDNTGGGGLAAFSDDFAGTLAKWTIVAANWDINSGALRMNDGGFTNSVIVFTDDSCNTTSGYFNCTRGDDGSFPRLGFRYSNDNGSNYAIEISNSNLGWYHYSSITASPTQIGSDFSVSTGIGTKICFTWEGTGTSTTIRVWVNPTGNTPTDIDTWGGSGPGHTWTDDPGTPVNSGGFLYIGGSQGTANTCKWDNFFGGDVP